MFLDQKEFSLIFSNDASQLEIFLDDLLNSQDPKFIVYFVNFINSFGKENPAKVVELFNKYLQIIPETNTKLLNTFLNFILDIQYNYGEGIIQLYKKYSDLENDYDKISELTKKIAKNVINQKIVNEILNIFFTKIKDFDFRELYLKSIVNTLKESNKILELEKFLTDIYGEFKTYWVVENLVDIYSSKEEYEKLTTVFLGLITSGDFAKLWAESLGIIDTTIEKITDKKDLIIKIIPHLQAINSVAEKSPKNVYKIYKGIIQYIENLEQDQKEEFLKAFYSFLDITNNKNILNDEQILSIVNNLIQKLDNPQIIDKITDILNTKANTIIDKLISEALQDKQKLTSTIHLISSKYQKLDKEILLKFLNSIEIDHFIKLYEANNRFIDDIGNEIILSLNLKAKDNIINLLIIKKDFEKLEEKLELIRKDFSEEQFNYLSNLSKLLIKLVSNDYAYTLYNIVEALDYPELLWYIYERLRDRIERSNLQRIFMGIFLYYMNVEDDTNPNILENFKKELLSMIDG
ncbi:MAG: hypothetical protein N2657_03975 [bacterium]|nr:hypothetical protein [bacterium]